MEATRTSVTSGNEQIGYNMDPAYQVGYTQQEVDGKNLKFVLSLGYFLFYFKSRLCKSDFIFLFFGETRDRKSFRFDDFLQF